MVRTVVPVILGLALAVSTAFAGHDEECRKKIRLMSTGVAADASGHAEVRSRGDRQRLKVEGEARVADGTTWSVHADGLLVGVVTIAFGEGELELDTGDGAVLPAGVIPVCNVSRVEIKNGSGITVLQGNF